ncbi:MAG: hypothetical protein M3P00_11430 [Gemmatimonadota bacterium]|nr:hypothetical protein [Gemmatimonadota bacterium]
MSAFSPYKGNCPKNVSRDAKYAVRSGPSGPVVGLLYRNANGEQWHPTTEDHPRLVEMVNAVKTQVGDAPNGPFYINEYGQVIVPVGPEAQYYYAGDYEGLVEFEFEGNVLSGRGVDLDGRALDPGDEWTGPHPGIPYVLKAGGGDVYYVSTPRANVTRKVFLSAQVGDAAKAFANRIQRVKGWSGGRFYVNEWREIFAPVNSPGGLTYTYVGHLELEEPWFTIPLP